MLNLVCGISGIVLYFEAVVSCMSKGVNLLPKHAAGYGGLFINCKYLPLCVLMIHCL